MIRFDVSALPRGQAPLTLVDLARDRALHLPDKRGYTFIGDGDSGDSHLTYAELDAQARAIGAWLQSQGATGQPVLLLYPPGLSYVAAVFGCLYAGAVAVPAYPPKPNRSLTRLELIVRDTNAVLALTTSSILSNLQRRFGDDPPFAGVRWLTTDTLDPTTSADWQPPSLDLHTAAVLQYTSGSTAEPKGAVLTHGGLLHNLRSIRDAFGHTSESHGVVWLPPYHDMGLIGGILQACDISGSVTLMSPTRFLQKPLRWLEAVSRERASTSGGPDFAFELCVRSIAPEQRATLDLSNWRVAFCGAEPIRKATIDRFTEAFAPCGFRPEAFFPCYGLAESTLFVSGGPASRAPVALSVDREALAHNRVIERSPSVAAVQVLVGCGHAGADQRIEIVRPESRTRCDVDEVGEIWLASPSLAAGYWNRPQESEEVFEARLYTGEGPFLRTGDLGFLRAGELFITGRLKDLVVIRGRKLYPQDIEMTVEMSQPALRSGSVVAFSVDLYNTGEERLVVVQEAERSRQPVGVDTVAQVIREAVVREHDVSVAAVVLVERLSIPKTSSGKRQRRACRAAFLDGTLRVVGEWRPARDSADTDPQDAAVGRGGQIEFADVAKSEDEITTWLVAQLAAQVRLPQDKITVDEHFVSFGMDSVQAVRLASELGTWLRREISPTLVYEFPTIALLARQLAHESKAATQWQQSV